MLCCTSCGRRVRGVCCHANLPNRSTVQPYFYAWQAEGLWDRVNFLLVQHARERDGRKRAPRPG